MHLTSWLESYVRPQRNKKHFLNRRRVKKLTATSGIEQFETRVLLSGTPLQLTGGLSADAYIKTNTNDASEENFGSDPTIIVDAAPKEAALLKFDVSALAPGSAVTSVSLTFTVTDPSPGTWEIYQVLKEWSEAEVTYDWPTIGGEWQVNGAQGAADRGNTVLGTVTATTAGTVTVDLNAAGIAVVQSWVNNPASNHGLIIQDYTGSTDSLGFASKENANAAARPVFKINYTSDNTPGNVAPVVNAGSNQTILIGQTLSLNGTVSDDGVPFPGYITTNWGKVTGPGTVTFGNASAVDTTATFSQAGTYMLRLRANDGELTSIDVVEITVIDPAANTAPVVNAGVDQEVDLDESAILWGTVNDDGLPLGATVTTTWSVVSGPGSVELDNTNELGTAAKFSAAGTYVFRFTASDGAFSASDEVTVTVIEPNVAPTVEAGESRYIYKGSSIQLAGAVTDALVPGTLTRNWSLLSGPAGGASISNAQSLNTTVTFSQTGTYVLKLAASDGELTSSDTVAIYVYNQPTATPPPPPQTPTTLTFQQGANGYTGMDDSYIRAADEEGNNGNSTTVRVDGLPDEAAFLRWGLTSVAAGSTVSAGSITINVTDASPHTFEIYAMKRNWAEGQITWEQAANGQAWQTLGASGANDRGTVLLGTFTSTTTGLKTFQLTPAALQVIQGWINDPSTNFGFVVQDYNNLSSDSFGFSSSETATVAQRPKLTLTVTPPAPPAPPANPLAALTGFLGAKVKDLVEGPTAPEDPIDLPSGGASAAASFVVAEGEGSGQSGQNDTPGNAEFIDGFGTEEGDDPTADINGNLANAGDIDFYTVDLEAGDIFGANVTGSGTLLNFYSADGELLIGSNFDFTSAHPASSPLPGGGNASLSYVIPTAGRYTISVEGDGVGAYQLQLRAFRPVLEQAADETTQILFLDFDGATLDATIFGGAGTVTLSALSTFLPSWGLNASNESAVIDAIIAEVTRALSTDIRANGNNGDFDATGELGDFDIEIRNSRDHADPFGQANVSRLIVGGTIAELGIETIGIAETIDVGNFDTTESAVILLDLLSAASGDPNSLNSIALGGGSTIVDLIGTAVGNISSHEAGHYFGNWHTDPFNSIESLEDSGAGGLGNIIGLGNDGIYGTSDDINVVFSPDEYFIFEGFTGTEDVRNSIAFGLSTGAGGEGSGGTGPLVTLTVTPTSFLEDEDDPDGTDNQAIVTATLASAATEEVRINLGFSGTALNNVDYTRTADVIIIPVGATEGSITLTAIDDDILENPNETVIVDIISTVGAQEDGVQRVTAEIIDDDGITVTLTATPSVQEAEEATVTFTATLSAATEEDVTVFLRLVGTATAGSDYTDPRQDDEQFVEIEIQAGELSGSVTITILDDDIHENSETIVAQIVRIENARPTRGNLEATAVIIDDDDILALPVPQVSMTLSPTTFSENGGVANLTFNMNRLGGMIVELEYSGTAVLGVDFFAPRFVFLGTGDGDLTETVQITGRDDLLIEPNETIIIDIVAIDEGVEAGGFQQVQATITSDDIIPGVSLSASSPTMNENGGTTLVTAVLNSAATQDTFITLAFADAPGDATYAELPGGAIDFGLTDYTRTDTAFANQDVRTIFIAEGQTTGSIVLSAVNDPHIEDTDPSTPESDPEQIVVSIASAVGAVIAPDSTVTVGIIDDDVQQQLPEEEQGPPAIYVSDVTVVEGDQGFVFRSSTVNNPGGALGESFFTPTKLAAADFDNDGDIDAIVSGGGDADPNLVIQMLRNNGDGTFTVIPIPFDIMAGTPSSASGVGYQSAVAVRLNDDGFLDLAISIDSGTDFEDEPILAIFLNDGAGGFAPPHYIGQGEVGTDITAGDFNNDTFIDLAVSVNGGLTNDNNGVQIFLNDGNGVFPVTGTITGQSADPADRNQDQIHAVDYDDDTNLDVVLAFGVGGDVAILFGNGDGTFDPIVEFDGIPADDLTVGNFNGDNLPDIAYIPTFQSTSRVNVVYNNGSRGFGAPQIIDLNDFADAAFRQIVGNFDIDQDGDLDLLYGTFSNDAFFIENNGDGTWTVHDPIEVPFETFSTDGVDTFSPGDIDGDLDIDVLVTTSVETRYLENLSNPRATFTVSLDRAFDETIEVSYAVSGTTANSGEDFNAASGLVTFLPGETSKTIEVIIYADDDIELDEGFIVTLSEPTPNAQIADGVGVGIIKSDELPADPPANVRLELTPTTFKEVGGTATLSVILSEIHDQDVTVDLDFGGTATIGLDYTVTPGAQVVIPAGQTVATVTLTGNPDGIVEGDEYVEITITGVTNAEILGGVQQAVATLGLPPEISYAEQEESAVTGDNDTQADGELINNLGTGNGESQVATVHGNISVAADLDYYLVQLEAGDVISGQIQGPDDVGYTLSFLNPGGVLRVSSETGAIPNIYPDGSPILAGGVSNFSYVVTTAGTYAVSVAGTAVGEYTLDMRVDRPFLEQQFEGEVQYLFLDFDGATIDASIFDWLEEAPAGIRAIPAFADLAADLELGGAQMDAAIDAIIAQVTQIFSQVVLNGPNPNADIRILNSRDHADPLGLPNVTRIVIGGTEEQLAIDNVTSIAESVDPGNFNTEETGVVTIPVDDIVGTELAPGSTRADLIGKLVGNLVAHQAGRLFGSFDTALEAPFLLSDNFEGPIDYAGLGVDDIFGTADDETLFFGTDVFDDTEESFTGTLESLTAVAYGLSVGTVEPPVTVSLNLNGNAIDEEGGSATISAILSERLDEDVTITLDFSSPALQGADFGDDYVIDGPITITILAGELFGSRILDSVSDSLIEGDETYFVSIADVSNSTVLISNGGQTVTGTILDNDVPGIINGRVFNDLDGDGLQGTGEGGLSGVIVYADLNHDGNRDGGENFAVTSGSGQYMITGLTEGTYEIRQELLAGFRQTAPANNASNIVEFGSGETVNNVLFGQVEVVVPLVTLELSKEAISENLGTAVVTARLSEATTVDVTVTLSLAGDAAQGSDYSITTTSIFIAAGQTSGTATITGINNGVVEPIERVFIGIDSATNGDPVSGQTKTLFIVDDDNPAGPSVTIEDAESVLEGNSNTGFDTTVDPVFYNTGAQPKGVTAGDVNGDGHADLLVLNSAGGSVSILLNNGDGTFVAGTPVAVGANPDGIALADFNNDGDLDFAVSTGGGIAIRSNNGDGTFVAAGGLATPFDPGAVTAGDFDDDGNVDLAFVNSTNSQSGALIIATNNGAGVFTQSPAIGTGYNPSDLVAGDYDNDGDIDLVAANGGIGSTTVTVFENGGTGSFSFAEIQAGVRPTEILLGDFTNDGEIDIAVANIGFNPNGPGNVNTVSILEGIGGGSFAAPVAYPAGTSIRSIASGDLDSDGDLDIVVTNDGVDHNVVTVLINNGNGSGFQPFASMSTGEMRTPQGITTADIDNDGDADVISTNRFGGSGVDGVSVFKSSATSRKLVFNVLLSEFSDVPIAVDFTTLDGSAEAGDDYIPRSGTLFFAPGQVAQTIEVTIIGDTDPEPNEDLFIVLSNPRNVTIDDGIAEGTITNDDSGTTPLVSLSSSDVVVDENGGSVTLTATLSSAATKDILIELDYNGNAVNTQDFRVTSNSAPISIDGTFDDWKLNPSIIFHSDGFGDTHDTDHDGAGDDPDPVFHPDVDILEYAVTHDDENFYFYFKAAGEIGRTFDAGNDPAVAHANGGRYYIIVTMDTDDNDATGYPLHQGGYYPTTPGYDMNAEIEYFNGEFNTGHYLNHGATNDAERTEAFLEQSPEYNASINYGDWVTQGLVNDPANGNYNGTPLEIGHVETGLLGEYHYYTQWVYKENSRPDGNGGLEDGLVFVKDRGPVVPGGIIIGEVSADGHEYEYKVPFKGFLNDQFDDPIAALEKIWDFSFSLEASPYIDPITQVPESRWASDTAEPINGYEITAASVRPVTTILIKAGQTSGSVTLTGLSDAEAEIVESTTIEIVNVSDGAEEDGQQAVTVSILDEGATALDAYIAKEDPNFNYSLVNTIEGAGYTGYVLDVTSQAWRTSSEVDPSVWSHFVTVVVPDTVSHGTAFLNIGGGSSLNPIPDSVDQRLIDLAVESETIVINLRQVPNQPTEFFNDGVGRTEDEIIAYTYDKFMDGGDSEWPLLLPMVKSAVAAMDASQEFVANNTPHQIDDFVVSGASKRGWTTWLTAAVDPRVSAIAPLVIDILNFPEQVPNHIDQYTGTTEAMVGNATEAVEDYTGIDFFNRVMNGEADELLSIVDPYAYIDRPALSMPKYIVNAAGDEFFHPTSSQFYFDDLNGTQNYLRYVPNADHGLNDDAAESLRHFYIALLEGADLPEFSWTIEDGGETIVLNTVDTPVTVTLWQSENTENRDFRLQTGHTFTGTTLNDLGGGVYEASIISPTEGAIAFFIEMEYDVNGRSIKFSTDVSVIPALSSPLVLAAGPSSSSAESSASSSIAEPAPEPVVQSLLLDADKYVPLFVFPPTSETGTTGPSLGQIAASTETSSKPMTSKKSKDDLQDEQEELVLASAPAASVDDYFTSLGISSALTPLFGLGQK